MHTTIILLLLSSLTSFVYGQAETRQKHPDVGLNVKRLIRKYKYPIEIHTVVTEDEYILELHRIPNGRNNLRSDNQSVVFLMPGVFCSSADWVNMGPEKSLGFVLADKGYDVWLGNYRGTTWSRKHVTLDPDQDKKDYWTFSFQEIAYYDAPASIDYILNVTKQEKLFYIGHSQGTATFFAMTSARPEYNDKIRLMSALAPVLYVSNVKSPFAPLLVKFFKPLQEAIEKYEVYEILPHSFWITMLGQSLCNDDSPFQDLCATLLFVISGFSPSNLNKTMIPVITSNTPAGASSIQFVHLGQLYLAEKFQQYDYGEDENLIKYGQPTPPEYDISKITAPVALYYSDNDFLSSDIDVERAAAELPNVVELNLVKGYNHLDFMWSINVVPRLYNRLIEVMEQY